MQAWWYGEDKSILPNFCYLRLWISMRQILHLFSYILHQLTPPPTPPPPLGLGNIKIYSFTMSSNYLVGFVSSPQPGFYGLLGRHNTWKANPQKGIIFSPRYIIHLPTSFFKQQPFFFLGIWKYIKVLVSNGVWGGRVGWCFHIRVP